MKNADARRIMDAARAEAVRMEKAVVILVVDAAGAMMMLERLDGTAPSNVMNAEGKANGAVFFGRDSVRNRQMAENNPTQVAAIRERLAGRFLPQQGAVVLRRGGEIVGAVAASGATSEEDEQISAAGADAVGGGESLT